MIEASDSPTQLYDAKAHSGRTGNGCADVIAKHAAFHNGKQIEQMPPPSTDGELSSQIQCFQQRVQQTPHHPVHLHCPPSKYQKKI